MIFSRTNSRKYRYLVYMIFLLKLKCNCYILFLGGFNGIFMSKNKSFKAPRLFVCFIRFVILENLNPRVFCRRYLNYVPNSTGVFMSSKKQLYKHDRLFHLSDRTITTHRDNIRKKLGLKAKKANLRTHLSSIN